MAAGGGGTEPPDKRTLQGNKMDDENTERESYLYTARDEGPYRIFIEIQDKTKSINKFSVGQLLRKLPRYRNYIEEMKYLGRKKIIVFFSSWLQANLLVGEQMLQERGYHAYVPRHLVCIKGVVSGVDPEIDIEDIKQEIESSMPVVDSYRMNRWVREKSRKEPSNRICITFRAKNLPEKIKIFGITAKVQPFVRRTEMCRKCHRYGHKEDNCKSKKRCERCSQVHDEDSNQCRNDVKCLHCRSNNHRSTDPECPAREREAGIKRMMAKQNLTYVEARELLPPILSSNQYELLTNADEYPTVPESFAKMTAGNYVLKQNTSKTRTAIRSNSVQNQEYHGHSHTIVKRKKIDGNKANIIDAEASSSSSSMPNPTSKPSEVNGTGLYNPFAPSNAEKYQSMYKKAQEEAQEVAYRNVRGELMSFYTALLQIPEVSEELKERIKDCSKKHLHFDQVIN